MTEIDIMYLITLAVTVAVILYQKRKIDRLEDKVIQSWKRFYRRALTISGASMVIVKFDMCIPP